MKHVKYDSYFGEYFSCPICLEKVQSWKALVATLKQIHLNWSPKCPTAHCTCGALSERTRNSRSDHLPSWIRQSSFLRAL